MNERNPSSGAMTGATGGLTPDDLPEPFIPAERREVSDAGPTTATPTSREPSSASATAGDTRIGGDAISDGGEHF